MAGRKLEGPNKHHANHGMNASVPGKHPISQEHWEHRYSLCEPSRNMKATEGADFVAKSPSSRKTTYVKVNREDH